MKVLHKYFRTLSKKAAVAASGAASEQQTSKSNASVNVVLDAIADRRFHFRTIPSIAAETGMPETLVRSMLEQHAEAIRRAPLQDPKGNALYTSRARPRTVREILAETRAFLDGCR